jgi:outer membrane immunogenic protein
MARVTETWGKVQMSKRRMARTGMCGTILAGTLSIGAPALAADMPVKAPVVVAAYSWSGPYVGLHAGYGWMRSNTSLDVLSNGTPTSLASLGLEEIPDRFRINSSGFVGGGQIGFNHQINRVVLGVEGDLSFSAIGGNATASGSVSFLFNGVPAVLPFLSEQSQDLRWLATLRGRLGYLPTDAVLLYATGGLAVGQLVETHHLQIGGVNYLGSATSTRVGWTVGGGAEYRLGGNWTAKLEYLYFDLGKTTVIAIDQSTPGNPFQPRAQFDHTGHIARIGINYRFGGPVVARY